MLDGTTHLRLVRYAARIVGPNDAEDMVQDAYVQVLAQGLSTALLYSAVRFLALNKRRADRRLVSMGSVAEEAYTPNYDARLDLDKQWAVLRPDQQALLQQYVDLGSDRAVAEALGLSANQVKCRRRRAMRRLREALA